MSDTNRSIEDLLLSTLDAVSRFRIGRLEAVSAALDAGALLTEAKGRVQHGEWGGWLDRVGVAPRTASRWMRLAVLGITAEDVVTRGGINAALRGQIGPQADLPPASDLRRKLAEAEAAIGGAKRGYYDALNLRQRLLRALARENRYPTE